MKINENQELKSSSMLAMFGLVTFCMMIIVVPWNRNSHSAESERALQKAEVVGYQFVQLYREASKNIQSDQPKGRSPASASPEITDLRPLGTMGTDPWGNAYRYRILGVDQNKIRILIWSAGPDLTTQSADLENEEASLPQQPLFAGDDLGLVMTMAIE